MKEPQLRELEAICERATCAPGYEVTRDGRVFSVESNWRGYGPRKLTQQPNAHGYASVRLMINGRRSTQLVHRLVALAFLPPKPSDEHQVRHLNGNRMDARADNLAWGTAKENADDRAAHGTTATGSRNGAARLTMEDAIAIHRWSREGLSQRAIANRIGISQTCVGYVLRGETWKEAANAV